MGVPMSVDIRRSPLSSAATAQAVREAFALVHADDARFSPFRSDSEVSQINRGERSIAAASPALREVLEIASATCRATAGAFDCWNPDGGLDTNGVVKGWSIQRASDVLSEAGIQSFCFNAGGDVVVRGHPEPGRQWHVAVRSPLTVRPLAVLALTDRAVATSGTYERGSHIWDKRAGISPDTLASVTVVADNLTTADVLATAVFVLGIDGVRWAAEAYDCSVLALDRMGELHASGNLRSLLAQATARC
jgi:FAD:protein FMN transferase